MNIFYDRLSELMKTSTDRSFLLSIEQYETLLQEIKQTQLLKQNYRRLKRYDILIGKNRLKVDQIALVTQKLSVSSTLNKELRFIHAQPKPMQL